MATRGATAEQAAAKLRDDGCDHSAIGWAPWNSAKGLSQDELRTEAKDLRVEKLQEWEEMAAKLPATARKLFPGQDRHSALREIGRFRAQIAALRGPELRLAHRGLKAKGKWVAAWA